MEKTKIVRLHGPNSRPRRAGDITSEALKELDRKAWRMHFRHLASWLTRVALFSGIIYAAVTFVVHPMGAVLSVISVYMLYRSLLFCAKGHRKIAKYRKAKRYWLKAEGSAPDIMSADVTEEMQPALLLKNTG